MSTTYLHFETQLTPIVAADDEITATAEYPLALQVSRVADRGVQHATWYLSHPWKGHQLVDVAYDLSKAEIQVWGGGECLHKATSHSLEEGLAGLRFKVVLP